MFLIVKRNKLLNTEKKHLDFFILWFSFILMPESFSRIKIKMFIYKRDKYNHLHDLHKKKFTITTK